MSLKVYIFPTLKLIFVQAVLNTVVYQMLIVYTNVLVNSALCYSSLCNVDFRNFICKKKKQYVKNSMFVKHVT